MLKSVAALLADGVSPFELSIVCEFFGTDRTSDGFPSYEFATCSVDKKPVTTRSGFMITPSHDLSAAETADLVAVPPILPGAGFVPDEILDVIRRAAARGAHVLSLCSGAFVLGEAGLLDDRRCTTHWLYAQRLADRYPLAKVDPDVLYVHDDNILTSAGTAAGIDACLHLIRQEQGSTVATKFARRLVVPPHRDGGQAQYIENPVGESPACETMEPLLAWMIKNLDQPLGVEDLALRALMAPRTFARKFRAETGETPHRWLIGQRILLARQLLEDTDITVEGIASRTGLGNAAALRHHFLQRVGTTPQAYRTTFQASE